MQNTPFSTKKTLVVNGEIVNLSEPKVMGILNITPDSFFAGSRLMDEKEIATRAEKMLQEGASFLDVGGYSSRPGAIDIPVEDEIIRIRVALSVITKFFPKAFISIDTFRSEVAKVALNEGAVMINDISAGNLDLNMMSLAAQTKVPYVMMHMRGTPQTMATLAQYDNVVQSVIAFFHQKIDQAIQMGIKDLIIDPGFGFAKTKEHNFELLDNLERFQILGHPLLAGLSRKSMIWKTLDQSPAEALNGTTALNAIAIYKGASILRVHDVKEAMEVIRLISQLSSNTTS